jgi:uncharacterized membrane protein
MSDPPQILSRAEIVRPGSWIIAGLSLFVIGIFLVLPTSFPLGKMDTVAYAVCHRIPERSFFIGGQQLPLCARCSGTFLGVLLVFVTLSAAGRTRASRLPPPRILMVLACFVLVWAIDGLNSYLSLFPTLPHLYEPQNWLRLTTGMFNGLALGVFAFAILQFSLWRTPLSQPVIGGFGELGGVVVLGLLLIGLVLTESGWLLYPLALASTLGVLTMLTSLNTVVVLIVSRRENAIRRWRDAVWPLLAALALSLAMVMGIGAARAALSSALDIPF